MLAKFAAAVAVSVISGSRFLDGGGTLRLQRCHSATALPDGTYTCTAPV